MAIGAPNPAAPCRNEGRIQASRSSRRPSVGAMWSAASARWSSAPERSSTSNSSSAGSTMSRIHAAVQVPRTTATPTSAGPARTRRARAPRRRPHRQALRTSGCRRRTSTASRTMGRVASSTAYHGTSTDDLSSRPSGARPAGTARRPGGSRGVARLPTLGPVPSRRAPSRSPSASSSARVAAQLGPQRGRGGGRSWVVGPGRSRSAMPSRRSSEAVGRSSGATSSARVGSRCRIEAAPSGAMTSKTASSCISSRSVHPMRERAARSALAGHDSDGRGLDRQRRDEGLGDGDARPARSESGEGSAPGVSIRRPDRAPSGARARAARRSLRYPAAVGCPAGGRALGLPTTVHADDTTRRSPSRAIAATTAGSSSPARSPCSSRCSSNTSASRSRAEGRSGRRAARTASQASCSTTGSSTWSAAGSGPPRGAGWTSRTHGQPSLGVVGGHHLVDEAGVQRRLGGVAVVTDRLARERLDHARAGEADGRTASATMTSASAP
jgi:hypothetical protein